MEAEVHLSTILSKILASINSEIEYLVVVIKLSLLNEEFLKNFSEACAKTYSKKYCFKIR